MPEVVVEAPEPHDGWSAVVVEAWEGFWGDPELPQAVSEAHVPVVYRLFDMRARQENLWRLFDEQPFLEGSQGQPVLNKAHDAAVALEGRIVALEDRLGLSPKMKAQMGLAFGAAKLTAARLNEMAKGDGGPDAIDVEGWEEAQ